MYCEGHAIVDIAFIFQFDQQPVYIIEPSDLLLENEENPSDLQITLPDTDETDFNISGIGSFVVSNFNISDGLRKLFSIVKLLGVKTYLTVPTKPIKSFENIQAPL